LVGRALIPWPHRCPRSTGRLAAGCPHELASLPRVGRHPHFSLLAKFTSLTGWSRHYRSWWNFRPSVTALCCDTSITLLLLSFNLSRSTGHAKSKSLGTTAMAERLAAKDKCSMSCCRRSLKRSLREWRGMEPPRCSGGRTRGFTGCAGGWRSRPYTAMRGARACRSWCFRRLSANRLR
jgi:hypothetical protein